jgi:hypothetical protein
MPLVAFGTEVVVMPSCVFGFDCTVIVNIPDFVESSVDLAVTTSEPAAGMVAGAV